jgi:hypothetical protein
MLLFMAMAMFVSIVGIMSKADAHAAAEIELG